MSGTQLDGQAAGTAASSSSPEPPVSIDVLDPRFYDDPWEAFAWLRSQGGLWWDERSQMWLASRHADVSHISRNPKLYSSAKGVRPNMQAPMSIISMDDPDHTRLRRLVNKGFTPRMVRALTDHMRELTRELLDEIADRGEIEFVRDFAIHLPLIVIAEMLGLDPSMRLQLYAWSEEMFRGDGELDPDSPNLQAAMQAAAELGGLYNELIEQRRQDGRTDDLIGILTQAYDEGVLATEQAGVSEEHHNPDMSSDELLMFLYLLLGAGNETTRNAITGGLRAFSLFPDEKQKLLDDPGLIDLAVDEIVRWVTPVLTFMRTVTEDHTYEGVDLKEGDRIYLMYGAANRDETVFDAPDDFRVDRDPNPHVGFGVGTHYCLGANLARNELKVTFEELFKRLSDIRAADPETLTRGDSTLVLAIDHLPAIFTPESRQTTPA
jgi:cholest-4-en-3-one 26-monooxygenase